MLFKPRLIFIFLTFLFVSCHSQLLPKKCEKVSAEKFLEILLSSYEYLLIDVRPGGVNNKEHIEMTFYK